MSRVVRAAAWFTAGYLSAFFMALAGSKFNGRFIRTWSVRDVLFRAVTWMARRFEQWRTWQGASEGQRYRWLRVKPLEHLDGDDRHDVLPDPHEPVVLVQATPPISTYSKHLRHQSPEPGCEYCPPEVIS